ncbi:hypothetical protein [Miltoncostaea oceani]|uniref:hypothetical protein n=1 Tax=Miltoncostaea oceani TaxID=2843216 RepID=UPI001C3CE0C0|nr:hypothetical protein [Miltoncostaea oceani]
MKFERAVEVMRREARRADRLARLLSHTEDYQATLTLASIVYPRADPRLADRIMRCESGPGRGTPSATAQNPTSSAGGRAQYLDTTWRSTPEGQAGLSRFDPVAGVFAIMRHLHNTGNDASPWLASSGCWS